MIDPISFTISLLSLCFLGIQTAFSYTNTGCLSQMLGCLGRENREHREYRNYADGGGGEIEEGEATDDTEYDYGYEEEGGRERDTLIAQV